MKRSIIQLILVLIILHSAISISRGQEEKKSKFDRLVEKVKSPEFNLGFLIQFVADYQDTRILPGNNGFSLGTARLLVYGKLDNGFGYLFYI